MNQCRIIEDLLPLYTDGLLQENTNEFVKLHLEHCADCSQKEKQLRANIESLPPVSYDKQFRRVKRKLRRKKLITVGISVILTAAILFCGYCGYYFTREKKLDSYRTISTICSWIGNSTITRLRGLEVSERKTEGNRAQNGDIAVYLPEGLAFEEEGYYVCYKEQEETERAAISPLAENMWFPTPSEDEIKGITDRIRFYETENPEGQLELTYYSWNKDIIKYFELGRKLVQEKGLTHKMELAEYYFSYNFSSLTRSSSKEELAVGFYLMEFAEHELFKEVTYWVSSNAYYARPITGIFSGYCFMGKDSEWYFYLENPKNPNTCYFLNVKGEKFFTSDFKDNEESIYDFLSRIEILSS